MKTLNIDISNSDIGSYVLDATPSNVQFVFSGLPDAWSGAIIYASFIQDAKNILVEVIDNSVAVPVEILADSTDFYVGINAVEYGTGKLVGYSMPVLVTIKVPDNKGTDVQKLIQLILKIGGIEDRLSDVATSGDYNDLLHKPVIDTMMNAESSNAVSNGTITAYVNDIKKKIINGDILVGRAANDVDGNNIYETYETKANVKSEISEAILNQGIQLIELDITNGNNFIQQEELDYIYTPGLYKLHFGSSYFETGWLIVCDNDSAVLNTSQTLINRDGTIYVRRRGSDYSDDPNAWSDWIKYVTEDIADNTYLSKNDASTTYATKTSVIPKISLWQPNTSYEVGNVVLATDPDGWYYIATCNSEHISSNVDSLFMEGTGYWNITELKTPSSLNAKFSLEAEKASADANGNYIDLTYATKTELRPTPITSTATAITANNSYNYGEQTELSIAFPTTANDGDVVYITFTSGATATVLTLDTTNTSDIELIPEANIGYEVYAKYNGTIWIVNYSDYTVTAEAGA